MILHRNNRQYYPPFKAMKQVYWTLSNNGNQVHELGQEQERVYQLAADNPNITGLRLVELGVIGK